MLNDKGRIGLRHLPAQRKWPAFETTVIRLPATEIRGGWAAGWYDWYPWQIESFTLTGERATVRSLTDRRLVKTIHRRELVLFEEICPGTVQRSRTPSYVRPWYKPNKPMRERYV